MEIEERNLIAILHQAIYKTLGGRVASEEICVDYSLPERFLAICKSYDPVPLVDTSKMVFLRLSPAFLTDPQELQKLQKCGLLGEEELESVKSLFRANQEHNLANNRTPDFYPLVYTPQGQEVPVLFTPMDDVVGGTIYSLSAFIPLQEHLQLQYAFFEILTYMLLSNIPYKEDLLLEYGYALSNVNKVNLFIALTRQ